MKRTAKPQAERTCARRLGLATQGLRTVRTRLYGAIGHKGFASNVPQVHHGTIRIYKEIEKLTLQLARLTFLQDKAERAAREKRLSQTAAPCEAP